MTPAWILDMFATIMLVVSAISAGRLRAAWPWRWAAHPDVDIAHLLMGISMAGMLVADLRTLPDTVWEVIFGVLTVWFARQVVRDARTAGARALAGGHCAPHLVHSAAMLYMYLALVAPSASGSAMSGMGAAGMQSLRYPTLAFAFGLVLAGYSVWDLDQLSGRRPATAVPAGPALAAVPAGVITAPRAIPVGGLLVSPAMAVACRIAMGITMALMLFIMI